ncbi:MAG: EF-hand domain-containing protein, partial [Lachnospiraceae bacterium]
GITGALSADEFFAQYDVNGDGEISQDEMPEPGTIGRPEEGIVNSRPSTPAVDEEILSEYDLDGDGVLSAEEYSAMMEDKRSEQITAESGSAGGVLSFDDDSDGTISVDEYEEMISELGITGALSADEFFAQYDVNGDGEISQDEMPEPGTIGASAEAVSGQNDEEDERIMLAEYQKLMFKTLQAYGTHYESMFDTVEGTLKKNQA